ncbi:MAG TPA: acyl-CoA dehydrogenase family protein [Solirubrobacteraceae bacterium]|jgi:alkylation response protein AidB-like acyl-CoA dehydrogenase|nr:acyl-CoA dehydrogenase family protein [Solirubrobacteraceae bacterium]
MSGLELLPRSVLGPEIPLVGDEDPFRVELRHWLADNATGEPEPLDQDEKVAMRRAWQRKLFAGGWAGPHWPERLGGRGAGPLQQFMYYEELALARSPFPANTPGIVLLGPTMMVHGTQELQDRFLPGILSGEEMWCQGFSEPGAGSDLAALRAKAVLDGEEWVINGQKTWTTWAKYADWCFVLCRTDPDSERHRGLTLIIIAMDADGVTENEIVQISGDPEFSEVFFDDARTPADLIVGDVGQGWTAAMTMFGFERGDQGFTDHARTLVWLHDIAEALRGAELSVAERAQARDRYADLWIRTQQLRRLNLGMAVNQQAGESIGFRGSVVNLFWGELEKEVAELDALVHGARGVLAHDPVGHELLSSRQASIHSGTAEIQRNIIAERILGLPR